MADDKLSLQNQDATPSPRAFTADELIGCAACARPNPPNRESCLYCGFALPAVGEEAVATPERQTLQTQTEPESAQYIVATSPHKDFNEDQINQAAALLELTAPELSKALKVAWVLPLSVNATHAEAETRHSKLALCGFDPVIISEQQLDLDAPAIDARAMEIREDSLSIIGPHGRGRLSTEWNEVRLLVTGHLHFSTFEVEQETKKRHSKLVTERRFSTDEAVLDIYLRNHNVQWRIKSNSFDFSCLGEDKDVTTFRNFASLKSLLRDRASKAILNDDYVQLRSVLDRIWPIETSEQPRQRRRAGWRELEASVTHASNEAQFERYSRVVRCMLGPT